LAVKIAVQSLQCKVCNAAAAAAAAAATAAATAASATPLLLLSHSQTVYPFCGSLVVPGAGSPFVHDWITRALSA